MRIESIISSDFPDGLHYPWNIKFWDIPLLANVQDNFAIKIMRFILGEDSWLLDAISPVEWQLISEIPLTASGEHFTEETRERLYPSPLTKDTLADESTVSQLEDWDELIKPDLEEGFKDAREVVQRDIETAQKIPLEEILPPEELESLEGMPEMLRLEIPLTHSEAWYSALNQARLLLNEEYDLADSEDRLLVQMAGPDAIEESRFMILAQYEIYSAIQCFLVDNTMGEG